MSLHFFAYGEDNEKEESINNYKELFIKFVDNPPSIEEALKQIFISGGVPDNQVDEYITHMINKINKFLNEKERESKIKEKYPNVTHEDSVIITSYTCEALKSEYSPYKILNRNLASDNREEGLKKVSKYLYILLKSLRKLKRYNVSEEQKYLYRGIKFKVETKIDPNKPKLVSYIRNNQKTFWAFTSTSWLTSKAFDFLGDNGYHEEKKLKAGTFFSLYGKFIGYDITLFNTYNEEEILLEPERKFRIENVIPDYFNDIINVTCEILDSPIVLNELKNISYKNEMYKSFDPNRLIKLERHSMELERQKDILNLDKKNIITIFNRIIAQLKVYTYNAYRYEYFDKSQLLILNLKSFEKKILTPQAQKDLINSLENDINIFQNKYVEFIDKYGFDAEIRNISNGEIIKFLSILDNKAKERKIKKIINTFIYTLSNKFSYM